MMDTQEDTYNFISMVLDDGDIDSSQLPDVLYWKDSFCPIDGAFVPHYHNIEWMKRIADGSYMCVIPLIRA